MISKVTLSVFVFTILSRAVSLGMSKALSIELLTMFLLYFLEMSIGSNIDLRPRYKASKSLLFTKLPLHCKMEVHWVDKVNTLLSPCERSEQGSLLKIRHKKFQPTRIQGTLGCLLMLLCNSVSYSEANNDPHFNIWIYIFLVLIKNLFDRQMTNQRLGP